MQIAELSEAVAVIVQDLRCAAGNLLVIVLAEQPEHWTGLSISGSGRGNSLAGSISLPSSSCQVPSG